MTGSVIVAIISMLISLIAVGGGGYLLYLMIKALKIYIKKNQ